MKNIKTSKLIAQQNIAHSITVSPNKNGGYKIRYSLKEKNKKGIRRAKTLNVECVLEDIKIPEISNDTVKHLGYDVYKCYETPEFYINFYQKINSL